MTQSSPHDLQGLVPDTNIHAVASLYVVEVCLRELIVREMSNSDGSKWYKTALPGGTIMSNYRKAQSYQSSTPWCSLVPHHPVHYLDFPDLATIIERSANWEKCFKSLFGRKDIFIAKLRALEPIRNTVAHNRKISKRSQSEVEAMVTDLVQVLGVDSVRELVSNCTDSLEIGQDLVLMRNELTLCLEAVNSVQDPPSRNIWRRVREAWWFDAEYLGVEIAHIEEVNDHLLTQYESLPKGWGSGHRIEQWLQEHPISTVAQAAIVTLDQLIRSWSQNE